ncbi:kelch-like protein 30 [Orbicella faveolata]|uniref:kelch-like protein 30 n=1 Tax=Orbicella faveolata TaxID=48498 RepID=UPI0009E42186|nr:kelch-like protein 30 [Orbicella faveolata]
MQDENQAVQELEQEFSKPWEQSDVVLLVEGQQFHVHRVILAMSSPVFSRMFSSDFKEKEADEIPLPEKKAAEIREMLMVIYPRFCKPVNATNLYFLLPLAREYQITVLSQKCEDYLLRVAEKEHEIGPLFETLIVAQNYTLERAIAECVNKTQKLSIEELQGHELYEQVEPLSQRKMIELQMDNMEKKLCDAKAELLESKAEISKLQAKIKEIKASASLGLESFELVVAILGRHVRKAKQINESVFNFQFTTEQNLATVCHDSSNVPARACLNLSPTYKPLKQLQDKLQAIRDSS